MLLATPSFDDYAVATATPRLLITVRYFFRYDVFLLR